MRVKALAKQSKEFSSSFSLSSLRSNRTTNLRLRWSSPISISWELGLSCICRRSRSMKKARKEIWLWDISSIQTSFANNKFSCWSWTCQTSQEVSFSVSRASLSSTMHSTIWSLSPSTSYVSYASSRQTPTLRRQIWIWTKQILGYFPCSCSQTFCPRWRKF